MTNMSLCIFLSLACAATLGANAAIHTEIVEYHQADTVLEGWLAYDDSLPGRRPGILLAHQWKGLTDYEKKRAEMLAKLGYVVFCSDVYGKGVRADNPTDAAALAGKYKENRQLLRARIRAGLDTLRSHPKVSPERIAAIGYCFGGTTVLELGRSGAALAGIVTFHGGLSSLNQAEGANIRARVLVLHGADDPFVTAPEVMAFEEEMRLGHVDWQLVSYGGAVHSFTDWDAGSDNSRGAAYNEKADRRSWEAMRTFFAEIFPERRSGAAPR